VTTNSLHLIDDEQPMVIDEPSGAPRAVSRAKLSSSVS